MFLKKESLVEILAKLVAVDGFSMNAVVKSTFIRKSIEAKGFNMVQSQNTLSSMLKKHAVELKEKVSKTLAKLIGDLTYRQRII
jgi:hypothetical protein